MQYLPITHEQYHAAAVERGLPAEIADLLIGLFTETLSGHNSYLTDGIQEVLGRAHQGFP